MIAPRHEGVEDSEGVTDEPDDGVETGFEGVAVAFAVADARVVDKEEGCGGGVEMDGLRRDDVAEARRGRRKLGG